MHNKSIKELSQALAGKEISSVELTEYFLQRAEKFNAATNSYITITRETALEQAKAADQLIADGKGGTLTGIPLAHKDIFCTKGIKTSCGSKMLDNFDAPYNATVINKFADAGAVMLGKANMDEFAMGSSNENSYYGVVKNPWDEKRVAGGSSGGSAAIVAARMAAAATGTDTGGSIRQPAAFCGISGIKPTYGRVSRYGMVAFASSLDQGGPLAKTAEDLALMLETMAGFDESDSTSANREVPQYSANLNDDIKGVKIGLPKQYFEKGMDDGVAKVVEDAISDYKKLGAEFVEIDLPNSDLSVPAYYIIAPAECSSNLSRFDGVRFGHRCDDPKDLEDMYKRSRAEGFGDEVKRRILIGTYALSAGYYDAYYLKAQKIRQLISNDFKNAFEKVDAILAPTTPTTAFEIGSKTDDPVTMYLSDIYTIALNLAGLPGMSIPAGFCENMPVGIQLIGNYFEEGRLLNIAHKFQQNSDWHKQSPEGF